MNELDFLFDLLRADSAAIGLVGTAVAVAGIALALAAMNRSRRAVQMRLLEGTACDRVRQQGAAPADKPKQIDTLVASMANGVLAQDPTTSRRLRSQLLQAGFFARLAVAYYFVARIGGALVGGIAIYALTLIPDGPFEWLDPLVGAGVGAGAGYFAPAFVLGRIIKRRQLEHRTGFPDVMDLMVVCAQAGLSMEAAIQRIGAELRESFPSLSRHMEMTSLELRSGKPLALAVEALGARLGITEATSFATLLQQSEELGSSISQSLRAYADDMRNKRLMKAEEKAYSLPAKLVVPLTLFVFPVLIVVLLLPAAVAVRIAAG